LHCLGWSMLCHFHPACGLWSRHPSRGGHLQCPRSPQPSDAEDAFLHSDYDRAVALYQAQLQQKPNDTTLTVGLVEVLLKQQKVTEADHLVHEALAQNPQSGELMGALAEVQYRAGTPWLNTCVEQKSEYGSGRIYRYHRTGPDDHQHRLPRWAYEVRLRRAKRGYRLPQ
jgi:Tetratricopeptide repeat